MVVVAHGVCIHTFCTTLFCLVPTLSIFFFERYTGDDRTGILYEILKYGTAEATVVPRNIFMEGNGDTDKGFKTEWAAVKGDELVVASFGKEYANSDGTIKNVNNNWVVVVDKQGRWVYSRARALLWVTVGYLSGCMCVYVGRMPMYWGRC